MNILIVDDEKMIRNWMAMLLQQASTPEIEIHAVSDVDSALAYCDEHDVRLLITDITMPQRTGLELLEILRTTHPEISTAVLSAHDDYQFTRMALQLGALDYILKSEMQLSDIESLLRKVELFSENTPLPAQGVPLPNENGYELFDVLDDVDLLAEFLQTYHLDYRQGSIAVHSFRLDPARPTTCASVMDACGRTLAGEGLTGGTFYGQKAYWVLYHTGTDVPEHEKDVQQKTGLLLSRNMQAMAHGEMIEEASFLSTDIGGLADWLQQRGIWHQCRIYYPDQASDTLHCASLDREELAKTVKRLRFLMETRRYADVARVMAEFVSDAHEKRIYPADLKAATHHCFMIAFVNASDQADNVLFASHYQKLNRRLNEANTAEEVDALVNEVCTAYMPEFQSIKSKHIKASLLQATDYIDQNYMHRLTLNDVSKHVFLNKAYLSQLFKKQLGISFVSYLESVRIYKAQELLRNTALSVTEIAEETGYASQSYFTKAFKKRVGMVPLKYRSITPDDANL